MTSFCDVTWRHDVILWRHMTPWRHSLTSPDATTWFCDVTWHHDVILRCHLTPQRHSLTSHHWISGIKFPDFSMMHCWGPNLFWHGCYECQILGPQEWGGGKTVGRVRKTFCQKNFFQANFSLVWIPIRLGARIPHKTFSIAYGPQTEWESRLD